MEQNAVDPRPIMVDYTLLAQQQKIDRSCVDVLRNHRVWRNVLWKCFAPYLLLVTTIIMKCYRQS